LLRVDLLGLRAGLVVDYVERAAGLFVEAVEAAEKRDAGRDFGLEVRLDHERLGVEIELRRKVLSWWSEAS